MGCNYDIGIGIGEKNTEVEIRMFQLSAASVLIICSGTGNDHGDTGAQGSFCYVVPLLHILTRGVMTF